MQVGRPQSAASRRPVCLPERKGSLMTLAPKKTSADEGFAIEDIWTGLHASGFGQLSEGRTFSFHVENQVLIVEIYRPRIAGPVPQAEDIVATATRKVAGIDLFDERSLAAAVRDAAADAEPVLRTAR
jgi:hypothetical protein